MSELVVKSIQCLNGLFSPNRAAELYKCVKTPSFLLNIPWSMDNALT